jgi:5'(3')-deoxyribonucleotidase
MKSDRKKLRLDQKPELQGKIRVLIDLDGVVRDFVGSLIRVYNRVHPDHQVKPVNSRKLEDFFPIGPAIYNFMEPGFAEEIIENAHPLPGAVEALKRWKNEYEIVIVTSQPDNIRALTYNWIGKYDLPTNEVHITYQKSTIAGLVLLDDFTDNLQEFADNGRLAVCMDQPWNKDWPGLRVKTVDEFFYLLQKYQFSQEKNENIKQQLT